MEQDERSKDDTAAMESATPELRYHTCGEPISYMEQLSGPAFYHERGPGGEHAFVTHCPRCHQTLAPDDLSGTPPSG
jgi:hypothetical protein